MQETWMSSVTPGESFPAWVPQEAQRYLAHTECGATIRALARKEGCAPSTVLRQVRKLEQKRDDPLVDEALTNLSRLTPPSLPGEKRDAANQPQTKDTIRMSKHSSFDPQDAHPHLDAATMEREARRVLRRLAEPGACLAVARDMEKAVIVRDLPDGRTTRTAVLDRPVAQAMALKDWIVPQAKGKITRYTITTAGRNELRRLLAEEETARAGFAEAPAGFAGPDGEPVAMPRKRVRYQAAESPVIVLSRRRDKDGDAFLAAELVSAAERLREDYELAQIGGVKARNWERFLQSGASEPVSGDVNGFGPEAAKARVAAALAELGPGLADAALRCCCYLEGMEQAEKQLGWSARSGKIVLRIALQRLKKHYDQAGYSNLIG